MTPDYPARLIGCGLAFMLALVPSCRQVVDFDEPRHPAGNDDPRTADAGQLFDPKPPFLSGPECLRCKEEKCQAEYAACDADDFCMRWAKEARALEQPLLTAIPLLHEVSDAAWAAEHGAADVTQVRANAGACVTRKCATECEMGRDFSCVGRFDWPDWPASNPKQMEIRVKLWDGGITPASSFDGWRVGACARQSVCQRPMGEAKTQGGGFATPPVDFSLAPPGAGVLPYFNGFLQIDGGGSDFFPAQLDASIPIFDQDYYGIYMLSRDLVRRSSESNALPPFDESRGLLLVWVFDCSSLFSAIGVTVEVWNLGKAGYHLCGADCAFIYPNANGEPDVNLEDFSSHNASFAVATAAPGNIMIVMRDTRTRLPLSVLHPVTIRPGYAHTIYMVPASRDQLASLPEEAR